MTRLLVGPFNRVEGDLEVQLDIEDGTVVAAHVNAPMYRGFEQILPGRDPMDALVIVPRICGICSVSQSLAAMHALSDLCGAEMPLNGLHATNLMMACENLADHLTHFYLFFMPDFARARYASRAWWPEVHARFEPDRGRCTVQAIAARQRWLTLLGTLGGKWPHTHGIQPGGTSRPIDASERIRLLGKVREFRAFLETTLFGDALEAVAELDREDDLATWAQQGPHRSDFQLFLEVSRDVGLEALGRGPGRYLSHGAYPSGDGSYAFARGVWVAESDELQHFDEQQIREDVTSSWLADGGQALRHPAQGWTEPQIEKSGAYTWNKAPRLAGHVVETGAIARQLASGQPLVRRAVARTGGNVHTRVVSRLIELARVVPLMEQWLAGITPREPFYLPVHLPSEGAGVGLTEAARGALGHWIRRGREASELPDRGTHQLEFLSPGRRWSSGGAGSSTGGYAGGSG